MSASDSGLDLGVAAGLPPKEAISYFEAKGYAVSWNWYEQLAADHARAFTVAKCVNLDVLNTIRSAVDTALKQGLTEKQFMAQLTPQLQKLGWWGEQIVVDSTGTAQTVTLGTPYRLKTIYQTNTRTAYAAGRYAQMMNQVADFPYWQYVAIMDSHTRPAHAELNNMIFRADDLFWQTHYPPNDWNCRCRVRALSEGRYQALGIPVTDSTGMLSTKTVDAGVDPFTGEVYQTTVTTFNNGKVKMTPGAGWSYNVGAAAFGTDKAACRKLIETPDPDLRRQFVQTLNNSPARQLDFALFVNRIITSRRAGHIVQTVGFMDEDIAQQVSDRTGTPPARMMVMGEKQILHADSDKHHDTGVALTPQEYAALPAIVAHPTAVLWDKANNNLLYVGAGEDGRPVRVVINAAMKLRKQVNPLDVIINAYTVNTDKLQAGLGSQYELLQGSLENTNAPAGGASD